jgi:hypothetical protein
VADARRFDALEHARKMTDLYRELLPNLVPVNVEELRAAQ